MNAAVPALAIGALAGAATTAVTAKALVDERTPSMIAPVVSGLGIAAATASATYLTHGVARHLLAGAAIGSVLTGAALAAHSQPLWNDQHGALDGVYRPERLVMIDPDVHAEGVVSRVSYPGDGDIHVVMKADANSRKYTHGPRHPDTIVAEPVPDDQGRILVPHVGDHIAVDGPLAWDSTHGWSEVHPVRNLTFLKADGPRVPRDPKELASVVDAASDEEHKREREALIGGGVALVGTSLLVGGAYQGVRAMGNGPAHSGALRACLLLAAGGAVALTGVFIGGRGSD
ncbi:MAG: hypothetical protein JWM98_2283 [Thermoleophilia bacterium]|nr:hypothetical protein [Thermoleophilia bacterium]